MKTTEYPLISEPKQAFWDHQAAFLGGKKVKRKVGLFLRDKT